MDQDQIKTIAYHAFTNCATYNEGYNSLRFFASASLYMGKINKKDYFFITKLASLLVTFEDLKWLFKIATDEKQRQSFIDATEAQWMISQTQQTWFGLETENTTQMKLPLDPKPHA